MSKYKASNIFVSFRFAIRGLQLALKSQRNFRAEVIIGTGVLIAAFMLKLALVKIAVLVLTIGFILVTELLNTVIEFLIDAHFGNRFSVLAKMGKDISAGAVLLSACIAIVVGILLFYPSVMGLITYFLGLD